MVKMSAVIDKVLKAHTERRLTKALRWQARRHMDIIFSARYALYNPASKRISLHCNDYMEPDSADRLMVERIFRAFKKMKADQPHVSKDYQPSSLWQDMLDSAYASLSDGLRTSDLHAFHYFLSNFGVWDTYPGVESTDFVKKCSRSPLGRLYLQNKIFYGQYKIWQWFYGGRKGTAALTYPMHGNQAGAYLDGVFVGVGSFFNEIYGSILAELVKDRERPVIADLGAGYGKLGYFIVKDLRSFSFVDFDLPETLCLASYYLMKTFPHKRVLLYGEEEYSSDMHRKYDLIFMPPWEIERPRDGSIDLFINKNSLGEMDEAAVANYIRHISRVTNYFFHMNHDMTRNIYAQGRPGLLGYEYPVPKDAFDLLIRYPDIGHLLYQGYPDFTTDIFFYLYKRNVSRGG